ncbi:serine/threonine-protein kinase pim-1-like [Sebastes fasciatus]|uniref:serine/threonine-protein kinase pim-1-like n=1 Tax=Sebastes fasciatus TaxID=394691 RepID=UPI003D9E65AE
MDRTRSTRRLQRRTCPYTSQDDIRVRLLKRRAREDEAALSSSVDVHRENLILSAEDESKRGGKREKKRRPDLDLTETKDDKLCTPQNLPAHVQRELPSTSELSSAPTMDRTRSTRRLQRRTCPCTKTVLQHRTMVSEGEHPDTSEEELRVRLLKRKTREDEEGPSSSLDVHRENLTETKDRIKLYSAQKLPVHMRRAAFEAKYKQQKKLGEGGCGSVFAGYRKADNLPVAIKHVPSETQFIKHVYKNGNTVSVEVAAMLKLAANTSGSAASSAPVSLLDWYDLEQELILVLERPVPCVDLATYICSKGGSLKDEEAKIILKQLLDAAIELQDKSIFHRDIKVQNILIETGSDVPRVRLIDFGLSCFVKSCSTYQHFYGTANHIPPELYINQRYRAGPTTAWQMGVVLFEALHKNTSFETLAFLQNSLRIRKTLSKDCKDFLQKCLTEDPKQRLTLEQLKHHPWLR